MHAHEMVEFAALVSAHGPLLIERRAELSAAGLAQYWAASRCRLDRWARVLKCQSILPPDSPPVVNRDQSFSPGDGSVDRVPAGYLNSVLVEILAGEVLARVWSAVLAAADRRRSTCDAAPIAESVLAGHVEARNRALKFLAHGPGITSHDAVELNRIRQRSERWTDLLLGHLCTIDDVSELAFHPSLALDFAHDLRGHPAWTIGGQAWPLALVSMRAGFHRDLDLTSPNADLNARIASAVLACFPPELFDSTGLIRTLWMARLAGTAADIQGMVTEQFQGQRRGEDEGLPFVVRMKRG
ncbi:MAG TPA: hypothetical protein VGX78_08020 [Pirellulales bacterium]|jgi:hypothetical protein|nr:hypothetical protein [Pirellulales bacterium]